MLIGAGFRGDLAAAPKRENIKEHEGRYVWVTVSAPKVTDATELRGLSDPLASQPPEPVVNPAHLNKEDVPTARFRIEEIFLERIKVSARRRALDPAKVEAIGESMERIGLQTPIMVYETAEGEFKLIVGLHRYAAAKSRSWARITCHIVQMDDLTRQLWEIDENLCRAELNELERSEHLAARKKIYEQLHPETRQHVAGALAAHAVIGKGDASANLAVASFAADTAAKTGLSERSIERAVHRAENIAPEIREEIRQMPDIADKGVELDALAKTPPEEQAAVVAAVKSGDAPNVRAAVASLGTAKTSKTSKPPSRAASNTDKRLDSIIEMIRLLDAKDRETLWQTLADEWHEEMSQALADHLPGTAAPDDDPPARLH
jgi:ParB family chromosome partitioning protein